MCLQPVVVRILIGVVAYGDELPDEVAGARHLIGRDPDVAEEFDELDL
jgi:hypothetical protein